MGTTVYLTTTSFADISAKAAVSWRHAIDRSTAMAATKTTFGRTRIKLHRRPSWRNTSNEIEAAAVGG